MFIKIIYLLVVFGSIHSEKIAPTFKYQIGGSHVFVFDNVINPKIATLLQSLMAKNQTYSYYYPDPYEKDNRQANEGNLHWRAPLAPDMMIKTRFWAGIRHCYSNLPDEIIQGRKYLPYVTYGTMLSRGDYTTVFQGDTKRNDSIFARVFLTSDLTKNVYSDQTFYDEDGEIVASIHPKVARVILWTGNVSTLIRPPSMGFDQPEYSILLKLTPHKEVFLQAVEEHVEYLKKVEEYAMKPMPFSYHANEFPIHKLNLSDHLIGRYYDKEGNMIAFFDDILPKKILDELRSYVTHYERGFGYNKYDPASSESHDNVEWVIQFEIEKLLKTPYWEAVKVLSEYMSNSTQWYPYDVAANLIQHTHHTRIHIDCVHEEYEYTFLLYLNPNWSENKYAETSFFDYAEKMDPNERYIDKGGEANEMYDFVAAAIPKFGRMAIFRNLIPHSARPPAPNFLAARYTFPVKVSQSYIHGLAKMLSEALDYKPDHIPDDPLYPPLRNGNYDSVLNEEKVQWLEEHLKKMKEFRNSDKSVERIEAILIPSRLRN